MVIAWHSLVFGTILGLFIELLPHHIVIHCRILSLYYENINTNASESLQTSYFHYKCVAIDKNGLRLLPNMLRICVFTNFRNMFLKFAKPHERTRTLTNTNECQAITMRPMRFVGELPRYYVNEPIRNTFATYSEAVAIHSYQWQRICSDSKTFVKNR